jgi:regulator of cell morphogenesis and NO signaling
MTIDPSQTTLAQLALERPSAARVLGRLGLDYCCGGRRSLAAACEEHGLDARTVVVLLDRDAEPVAGELEDWSGAPLAELCTHIVGVHHRRLRWELPRLSELADSVVAAHAGEEPSLGELRDELAALRRELDAHMADEELRLFPSLVAGEAPARAEVARLEHEHDGTGERLRRLRRLAGGYAADGALCTAHRALLEGLHGLELDLHQHVHEENNVLFPRALGRA